jgi:hypothetical protein
VRLDRPFDAAEPGHFRALYDADIGTRARKLRTKVSADCADAVDADFHEACLKHRCGMSAQIIGWLENAFQKPRRSPLK